ncbi:TnsA endonuclease N-terminal domain-containing protein [Paracoccus versutus]|uniref:TnsA endonuclease N-terminal domain-containing protein n=1 Tax=Paracoccus versutus TaxID=34007 RepID=UPI000DF80AE9|nr:TnsA endonuclease N-terminal domain-containing protein [Paracoccus versutus]RDD72762.1 hypothetical protein DVR11_04260 [Paracoccus versutus]
MPLAYETNVFTPPLSSRATRPVGKRSRTSVRTFMTIQVPADLGRLRRMGLESKGEADCLFLNLATGRVFDVREQVEPVSYRSWDGKWHKHTFDFLFTMTDGTRIATAVKPYEQVVARRFDRELAYIARAAVPVFCDKVVLFTDRDYTPAAAKDARRLYYSRLHPDPEADAVLSRLCTDLHGRVQIRALVAQAADIGGRIFGAVLRAIGDGDLLHLSRGQIAPTSFVGRPA